LEGCSGTANRKISRQRKAKVCGVEWARVSASSRFCASTSKKIAGANGFGMIDILAERQESVERFASLTQTPHFVYANCSCSEICEMVI